MRPNEVTVSWPPCMAPVSLNEYARVQRKDVDVGDTKKENNRKQGKKVSLKETTLLTTREEVVKPPTAKLRDFENVMQLRRCRTDAISSSIASAESKHITSAIATSGHITSSTAVSGHITSVTAATGSITSSTAASGHITSASVVTVLSGYISSATAKSRSIPSSSAVSGHIPSATAVISGSITSATVARAPKPKPHSEAQQIILNDTSHIVTRLANAARAKTNSDNKTDIKDNKENIKPEQRTFDEIMRLRRRASKNAGDNDENSHASDDGEDCSKADKVQTGVYNKVKQIVKKKSISKPPRVFTNNPTGSKGERHPTISLPVSDASANCSPSSRDGERNVVMTLPLRDNHSDVTEGGGGTRKKTRLVATTTASKKKKFKSFSDIMKFRRQVTDFGSSDIEVELSSHDKSISHDESVNDSTSEIINVDYAEIKSLKHPSVKSLDFVETVECRRLSQQQAADDDSYYDKIPSPGCRAAADEANPFYMNIRNATYPDVSKKRAELPPKINLRLQSFDEIMEARRRYTDAVSFANVSPGMEPELVENYIKSNFPRLKSPTTKCEESSSSSYENTIRNNDLLFDKLNSSDALHRYDCVKTTSRCCANSKPGDVTVCHCNGFAKDGKDGGKKTVERKTALVTPLNTVSLRLKGDEEKVKLRPRPKSFAGRTKPSFEEIMRQRRLHTDTSISNKIPSDIPTSNDSNVVNNIPSDISTANDSDVLILKESSETNTHEQVKNDATIVSEEMTSLEIIDSSSLGCSTIASTIEERVEIVHDESSLTKGSSTRKLTQFEEIMRKRRIHTDMCISIDNIDKKNDISTDEDNATHDPNSDISIPKPASDTQDILALSKLKLSHEGEEPLKLEEKPPRRRENRIVPSG